MRCKIYISIILLLWLACGIALAEQLAWKLIYQENFDTPYEAYNGQTFGTDGWLTYQLINGGAITVADGYAQLNAPDFWNAALIHSTNSLPSEYKLRTKIGYINYDLTNYEQEDYDDPYFDSHGGHYENGIYFLTLTEALCSGDECAEEWWHFHRKIVIDVDNHINYGEPGETFHPIFMVYMDPIAGTWGNILRTWDGMAWDLSDDNWNVAYTYEYDTWYYAEVEKYDRMLTLRLYDADMNILEETDPVDFDLIYAIDDLTEYFYMGEPHTDDYEGDARIDDITYYLPYVCGDANGDKNVNVADASFVIHMIFFEGPEPIIYESGDANGDGNVNIADASYVINYVFFSGPDIICPAEE